MPTIKVEILLQILFESNTDLHVITLRLIEDTHEGNGYWVELKTFSPFFATFSFNRIYVFAI